MNIFVIPGNPPAVHFYDLWKKEIEAMHPEAFVRVSPYPQLSPTLHAAQAMDAVAETHAIHLHNFHRQVNSPISIVGHSLGGHFALRLLDTHAPITRKVILIHPFLRRPTLKGQLVLRLLREFQGRERLQDFALRSRKALELFSQDLSCITDEEVMLALSLAGHEEKTIARDHSVLTIDPSLRKKIKAFYTAKDTWCSPSVVSALKSQVEIEACHEPHSFITSADHRQTMFERISRS